MDVVSLCCSSGRETIQLGRAYDDLSTVKLTDGSKSSKRGWKVMWRRILTKGKRKIFDSPVQVQVPYYYDAYSYAQNFDQGLMWDEPDCLSRSFSMRFADPSRVFLEKAATVI
ncbi:hypothetical protein Ancab_016784 [Ancistrocladus abbreviatus]